MLCAIFAISFVLVSLAMYVVRNGNVLSSSDSGDVCGNCGCIVAANGGREAPGATLAD